MITEFVEEWTLGIEDLTPTVTKIREMQREGKGDKAERHLPPERVYPVPEALKARLLLDE